MEFDPEYLKIYFRDRWQLPTQGTGQITCNLSVGQAPLRVNEEWVSEMAFYYRTDVTVLIIRICQLTSSSELIIP